MPFKLVYWDLRGLGEPLRYMLRYSGQDWEDDRIPMSEDGFKTWMSRKDGLPLGNLPYLVDGDVQVTQSAAVARYLARRIGLMPSDEKDLTLCEMVEQEVYDLKLRMSITCYDPYKSYMPGAPASEIGKHDYDFLKAAFEKRLRERLEQLDKLYEKGFLLGSDESKICYADFLAYEFMDHARAFCPECFEVAPNFVRFMGLFEGLKGVKEWQNGEVYKAGQYINSPMAKWAK